MRKNYGLILGAFVVWTLAGFTARWCAPKLRGADFPYRGEESYEGTVKPPGEFFDIPLGNRFTPHHDVERFCRHLAAASPRVELLEYGRTAEGRALLLLFVSSADNIARRDEILDLQQRLANPRLELGEDGLDGVLNRLPAVVWLSYNVHGNEASGTEAALRVLYQLVDGADQVTTKIRERVFVIVDPLLNPDGRERYLTWYHGVAQSAGNPEPDAREHSEPWPGGRTNHYYFDLNRDWSWLSQIETRARAPHYLRWQPLVHVDVHEMSAESTYFFFPAEEPVNTNLPEHTRRWGERFGKANAAAFDRFGWRYYTAESFDLFYPGYGDSWASFHGAIGMTYEQAGGGRAGLRYRRRSGKELTLRDRLHHHFVSSMATLETAADQKEDLQRSFRTFREEAMKLGSGDIAEYIFPPGADLHRLRQFIRLLIDQGIEVEEADGEFVAESLETYLGEKKELVKLPRGTYLVSLSQPASRLAKALLEPEANVTENKFYDISAWSLPFSMGLEAYFARQKVAVNRIAVTAITRADPSPVERASYAYLLRWQGVPAARALYRLQSAGVATHLIPKRIVIGDVALEPGTILVPLFGNSERVHELVPQVAEEFGAEFHSVASGWTDEGIDLGSGQILALARPRIAVATGPGVASASFGAIWYLFERELGFDFTNFQLESLQNLDFDRYNVIVFPHGWGYRAQLNDAMVERLRSWVSEGGVLVALGGGAFALTAEQSGLTALSGEDPEEKKASDDVKERRKIEDLRQRRRDRQVPGNIFRVDLDREHPLSFGLAPVILAFMEGTRSFAVSGTAADVGAFTDDPAVSGYISKENIAKIRRRVYLAEEARGRGRVVLFAGDPNFRLFWRGLTPLFLNAVLLRATE